jgi:hypothetical protein
MTDIERDAMLSEMDGQRAEMRELRAENERLNRELNAGVALNRRLAAEYSQGAQPLKWQPARSTT